MGGWLERLFGRCETPCLSGCLGVDDDDDDVLCLYQYADSYFEDESMDRLISTDIGMTMPRALGLYLENSGSII